MAEPYVGEIRIFSFNFPPKGWAFCNGQLLLISANAALFSILGTTYGGDGRVNFGLPNFQGCVPMHTGNGFVLGQAGGEQAHTVTISELPTHTHLVTASSNNANQPTPGAAYFPVTSSGAYAPTATTTLAPQAIANAGASQAHDNMSPYLTLSFCIALQGVFPSHN